MDVAAAPMSVYLPSSRAASCSQFDTCESHYRSAVSFTASTGAPADDPSIQRHHDMLAPAEWVWEPSIWHKQAISQLHLEQAGAKVGSHDLRVLEGCHEGLRSAGRHCQVLQEGVHHRPFPLLMGKAGLSMQQLWSPYMNWRFGFWTEMRSMQSRKY